MRPPNHRTTGAWLRAVSLLLTTVSASACASASGIAPPVAFPNAPRPPAGPSAPPLLSVTERDGMLQSALALVGTPYQLGGDTPEAGLDCSGFVRYVFGLQHVDVPRTVTEQFAEGRRVSLGDLRAGDLIFFSTTARGATHVGIALGDRFQGEFVHAPGAGGAVRIERFDTAYWWPRIVGVRRVF